MLDTIKWENGKVYMLDQRKLPFREIFLEHSTCESVAHSIKNMVIRGAPAIGVAAALGVAVGICGENAPEKVTEEYFKGMMKVLGSTRPTAVNLFWALEEMQKVFDTFGDDPSRLKTEILNRALAIKTGDEEVNRAIGETGKSVIGDGDTVLTHCNAGSLATAGYGTALGVIRSAFFQGKKISVIAGETRPFLQGARLTVWELQQESIPVTLITDNMAGHLMSLGKVDLVIVGADRIALNGDTANKIGTYSIAVLAKYHGIPFYVAAPSSTIDFKAETGKDIPIEERSGDEVRGFMELKTARPETTVLNPAFDITPVELISGIITEKKIIQKKFRAEFRSLFT